MSWIKVGVYGAIGWNVFVLTYTKVSLFNVDLLDLEMVHWMGTRR